jgi:phosphotransferase system HPr-like phosphotransfer protein
MIKVRFRNMDVLKEFVDIVSKYRSDVIVHDGKTIVDGGSIMGLMALGLYKTFELEFIEKEPSERERFMFDIERLGITRF